MTETAPVPVRLQPGDRAPDFTLPDADGRPFPLAGLTGRKAVVYFYPAAGTPGCTGQACDFEALLGQFEGAGFAVVGISPDPPAKLARFRDAQGLTFPLLSDLDRAVLTAYGAYGEKKLYGKTVTGVIRTTVVLAEDGRVLQASYGVRAKGHVAKLSRELGLSPGPAA
jgi:peroxiredoxin Q/BCP